MSMMWPHRQKRMGLIIHLLIRILLLEILAVVAAMETIQKLILVSMLMTLKNILVKHEYSHVGQEAIPMIKNIRMAMV